MLGFVFGAMFGWAVSKLNMSFKNYDNQLSDLFKKQTAFEEKHDPANWWKYGGDPFAHLDFQDSSEEEEEIY